MLLVSHPPLYVSPIYTVVKNSKMVSVVEDVFANVRYIRYVIVFGCSAAHIFTTPPFTTSTGLRDRRIGGPL